MKHMTNAQIDELNRLLKNHSDVLTGFYDEGIEYGMKIGARNAVCGMLIGVAIYMSIAVVNYVRKRGKTNEEEP